MPDPNGDQTYVICKVDILQMRNFRNDKEATAFMQGLKSADAKEYEDIMLLRGDALKEVNVS